MLSFVLFHKCADELQVFGRGPDVDDEAFAAVARFGVEERAACGGLGGRGHDDETRGAEAEAKATDSVSKAIAQGDVRAINYFVAQKYVEAFGKLASSPNQKTVIIPADMSSLVGSLAGVAELLTGAKPAGPAPRSGSSVPTTD